MGLDRINEIRKMKGMTIEELSFQSDVPISTLKKICAGTTTNPALETVKSIARALNCSLNEFDDNKKAPAYQELSREALHIASLFDRMDGDGRALLRNVADYIEKVAMRAPDQKDQEAAQSVKAWMEQQGSLQSESQEADGLKNG